MSTSTTSPTRDHMRLFGLTFDFSGSNHTKMLAWRLQVGALTPSAQLTDGFRRKPLKTKQPGLVPELLIMRIVRCPRLPLAI